LKSAAPRLAFLRIHLRHIGQSRHTLSNEHKRLTSLKQRQYDITIGSDRDRIVEAALDLLDQTGIEGLTMRRLAETLNVQAPALYWHFPNKPALLDEMAEALLAGVAARIVRSDDYGEVLRQCASELRQALLSRRDGARVFAGTFVPRPNVLRLAEEIVAVLTKAGFDTRTATRAMFSLLYFVLGFVIEEQALQERAGTDNPASRIKTALQALPQTEFPNLREALSELVDRDQDARFAFGVEAIIRGLVDHIDGKS
jgi:TetR/AcrR family tetracycline transcriptional repressor